MIDPEFLAILACPICPDRPALREEGDTLVCVKAGHRFPVVDGIPHLMPEDETAKEGSAV
ncbi:MAG TPA: Trm112 family protein [Fimbriimonadaceae bacterium]|nr:Trm112 family protein [Fimbriimonadaceae bacterium]